MAEAMTYIKISWLGHSFKYFQKQKYNNEIFFS